jgi:hypothetical protein
MRKCQEIKPHTSTLRQKTQNVPRNKHLRQPPRPDNRMRLSIRQQNDSSKDHIYRCCEEGRSKKDEERLADVGSEGPVWRLLAGDDAPDVAD